jgi:hypothetical protein
MLPLAQALEIAGFTVYAAPVLAMTAWLSMGLQRPLAAGLRRYLALGPVLGIALGACILGAVGRLWLEEGGFTWNLENPQGQLAAAQQAIFLLVWVSNIKLEIWTLDGARAAIAEQASPESFQAAASTLRRHLWLHSVGLLTILGLSCR